MTNKQIVKLKMFRAVIAMCNEHAELDAIVPAIRDNISELERVVVAIDQKTVKENKEISELSSHKLALRKQLIKAGLAIANPVYAYAVTIDDKILQQDVNFNFSDLNRIKENSLGPVCAGILAIAEKHNKALLKFGITEDGMQFLRTAIKEYSESVPMVRNEIQERRNVTLEIMALFKQADILLKTRLDKLIAALKISHPDFCTAYKQTRKLTEGVGENEHWEKLQPLIRRRKFNANR